MSDEPKLPDTAWTILGLLSFGRDLSGYDVRKWAESSLAFFYWAPSPSQIYAELRRLSSLELVAEVGPAEHPRNKQLYRLTPAGLGALRTWLDTIEPGHLKVKHPTAVRVWLGHLMDPGRLRAVVEQHRDEMAAQAVAAEKASAVAAERSGWEYPSVITASIARSFRAQHELTIELLVELDRLADDRNS